MKPIVPVSISAALITLAVSAGLASAVNGTAPGAPTLEVAGGPAARSQIAVTWNRTPRSANQSWRTFASEAGGAWNAVWDADTRVPHRIFGPGIHVPGSVKSPEIAEKFVWEFLAGHIDLLAPGARLGDFTLASNHLDHKGIRSIGLVQSYRGVPVIGGQVSFRFRHDRLAVIGSEALPHVRAPMPLFSLDQGAARDTAVAWVRSGAAAAVARGVDGPFILPIISHGTVAYHTVMRAAVAAEGPLGLWHVYVDATTGQEVARMQTLLFASGEVVYNVPDRHPRSTRNVSPARDTDFMVDSAPLTSDADGRLTWPTDVAATVSTSVSGPLVAVDNRAGDTATVDLTLQPDGTAVWSDGSDELIDAQITTYIHSRIVKDYSRRFAPDLAFLDDQLSARVNIDDSCNAFSDGTTINFFRADQNCQNTGRLADVVYHEFGHSLHSKSIIAGVGAFDGAFSEGLSDYLAATITGDPGMGRGFFLGSARVDEPLRHIDPAGMEHRWPDDIAEVHFTGLIFAGAMWDLREKLIEKLGVEEGITRADDLFYAAVKRASSIPSTYVEILLADDDDGDLGNGTPNECEINAIFGAKHGLRTFTADFIPLAAQTPDAAGYDIRFGVSGLTDRCVGDTIVSASLEWGLRGAGTGTPNTIALQGEGAGASRSFSGTIPQQPVGSTVRYRITVKLFDGGIWTFPTNIADPAYEFYVGEVVELYCTQFDSDPFAEGWSHGTSVGDAGKDDWEWAAPAAMGSSVDAPAPFIGDYVLGNTVSGGDSGGIYPNAMTSFAEMPAVDLTVDGSKTYSDVRLHYRRWLTVEDALYDQATIYADGNEVWRNLRTEGGSTHHLDTGWVFHDVPLSRGISDSDVKVRFELKTDEGLEFGGWTIDDLCVVARADSICGDSRITGVEECDDGAGNSNEEPNGCRVTCRAAFCGDGVEDDGEECDFGPDGLSKGCNGECNWLPGREPGGCGCTTGGRESPAAPLALLLGFAVLLAGQRIRAARR